MNYNELSYSKKYSASVYWAVMTLTTVGYGDISAKNEIEMIYSCLVMLFGSAIFAYSVNHFGMLLGDIFEK